MGKTKTDKLQGTLDLLILKTLSIQPMHGYAIAVHVQRVSDGMLEVQEGSLYPALHRIEHDGWIASKWGITESRRRAKFYRITRPGRKQLKEEERNWFRFTEVVAHVLRSA